ncbi:MAG: hypothetical protein NTV85_27810, partial [Hyphomicrobiales bacterium]|nr:hypothetical protein [Hyphomicrobiales bacterium]
GKAGQYFLEHAIESANAQELDRPATIHFFVGTDPETEIPARLAAHPQVTFARGARKGQIPALNAAIGAVDDSWDLVGFLEDDDHWLPPYLGFALRALESFDFVSSTQLETDEAGEVVRINDFATPSGWLMRRATFAQVGAISPASKWHYDNEWLGRLAETGLRRAHLVEATAPVTLQDAIPVRGSPTSCATAAPTCGSCATASSCRWCAASCIRAPGPRMSARAARPRPRATPSTSGWSTASAASPGEAPGGSLGAGTLMPRRRAP